MNPEQRPTPETSATSLELLRKSMAALSKDRGKHGDKTVEQDIECLIAVISQLERQRDELAAKLVANEAYQAGLLSERDEAREELENWKASGIHSCHPGCKRPLCSANRQIKAMREAIKEAQSAFQSIYLDDIFDVAMREIAKKALAKLQPLLKP